MEYIFIMRKSICFLLIFCILSSLSLVGCNSDPVDENTPPSSESTPPDSETVQPNESPVSDFEIFVNDSRASINGYFGTDKTVVIPERIDGKPVTGISNFANNENIEKVVIPSTVTCIWEYAFANCSSLKEVVFGDGITEIMPEAFQNCTSLEEVKLPPNLEKLGYKAFRNCTSLKKVFIPKSLTEMGHTVFANCSISELTFEDGIKTIGASAAFWCGDNLKSVTIPASVEEIGEHSFDEELEKAIFLGDAPKKIGTQPFGENTVIYYKKGTNGWEDTPLKDICTLVELQ